MAFTLPPLPYPKDALEPYISAKTLDFHHDKHHKAYVDTLNKLVEGKPEAEQSLEEIIAATHHDDTKTPLFNNAAQAWNHAFFWDCMAKGGGAPPAAVKQAIDHDFGSHDKFAKEFKETAVTQFGSGWAWLVFDSGKLKVIKTANAINPWPAASRRCSPATSGSTPIISTTRTAGPISRRSLSSTSSTGNLSPAT